MAIKDKKIPTPSEVKSSPHSFDKQELNELRELRDRLSQLSFQFGQLSIQKIQLEDQEASLKDQLKQIEKEESDIANKLTNKYGKGSIDLETGTFVPLE